MKISFFEKTTFFLFAGSVFKSVYVFIGAYLCEKVFISVCVYVREQRNIPKIGIDQ